MSKLISDETLIHFGFKGMKWGFNKGKRNGKRVAQEGEMGPYTKDVQDFIDYNKDLKLVADSVGPITFDKNGNPSFNMLLNSGNFADEKNAFPLKISLEKVKSKDIKDYIDKIGPHSKKIEDFIKMNKAGQRENRTWYDGENKISSVTFDKNGDPSFTMLDGKNRIPVRYSLRKK